MGKGTRVKKTAVRKAVKKSEAIPVAKAPLAKPEVEMLALPAPLGQNLLNYILNSSGKGSEIVALADALRNLKAIK